MLETFEQARLVEVSCDACGGTAKREQYPLRRGCIVQCPGCGFSFVSPRVESAWLQARLQHWAERDVVDAERLRISFEPGALALYGRHLARLEQLNGGTGRLLDVGCATGALLSVARERGWQTHGLELGQASSAYAQSLGLQVARGSLYDAPAPEQPYDAIAFMEVIEHLESPHDALKRLASWLKPGGLLLLSTPNYASLYRRLFGARWWVVNCEDEHIAFFTPKTLEAALRAAGFKTEHITIRGLDAVGMLRQWRRPTEQAAGDAGYEAARGSKEGFKAKLRRIGLLDAVRASLRALEWLMSLRGSPLFGLGEQIVIIARRSDKA